MTPTLGEVARSLYGVYRLARADEGGMAFLDRSLDGFWKSFHAAVILAPLFAALIAMRMAWDPVATPAIRQISIEAIMYVIGWVAFPLAMAPLADLLQRRERYLGYIVAYNWSAVVQNAFYIPLAMADVAGVIPHDVADSLALTLILAVALYEWFITRTALDVPGTTAVGLVLVDFIISLLIRATAESMIR